MIPILLILGQVVPTPVQITKVNLDGGPTLAVRVVGSVTTSAPAMQNIQGGVFVDGGYVYARQEGAWTAGIAGQVTVDGGFLAVDQRGTWSNRITDGTDTALVSGSGSLQVTCDNCGGASPFEDNDAFTPGTSSVSNVGFEVDDTATTAITENSAGAARMTTFRSIHNVIRDGAGNERSANVNASNQLEVNVGTVTVGTFPDNEPVAQGTAASSANRWKVQLTDGTDDNLVSAAGGLVVDGSGVTQPVSISGANFPDNEPINVAQMNGTAVTMGNGIAGTGVQRVTIASDSTGQVAVASFPDNEPFNLNQLAGNGVSTGVGASGTGTLRTASLIHDGTDTALVSAAGALTVDGSAVTQPVSIAAAVTVAQATASSLNAEVQGDAAHAATISGNPIQAGAYAEADAAALDSTGVAEGEATRLKATVEGVLLVDNSHPFRFHANSGLSTATTLTQIQAAPGASVSLYITDFVCSASVASTTTTDQQCTLRYGTGSNCGTGTTYITACFNQANGGCAVNLRTPIKLPANNALCWIHAAAGSKVVSVMGYTAP